MAPGFKAQAEAGERLREDLPVRDDSERHGLNSQQSSYKAVSSRHSFTFVLAEEFCPIPSRLHWTVIKISIMWKT